MENTTRLVEMSETDNGYSINNLSPFFIHTHISEMLEKAKTGLLIYRDLLTISTIENMEKIIRFVKSAKSVDEVKKKLVEQFAISECTADHLLEASLDEICLLGTVAYDRHVEMYEEAVSAFTKMCDIQIDIEKTTGIED